MQFEKIINTAYSFGAAIVVFGAWAKLGNKDYSETALTTGLLTEACIFIIYGLMEWRKGQEPGHAGEMPVADPRTAALQSQHLAGGVNTKELTDTIRHTNRILNKVFRAE